MSAISFSGGGLSAQLLHAIDGLARDLRAEHRERAESEANLALQEGYAEADQLREKADKEKTGAIVNGIITGVSGAAQGLAASSMKVPGSGASPEELGIINAHNARQGALGQAAGTSAQVGKTIQDGYNAAGSAHEASAREHSARAQAASRRADAAQGEAQEAQRTSDKARDLHQQIQDMEHASRMAVLRG